MKGQESDFTDAIKFVKTGKNFSDRIKILFIFALSFLRNRSPSRITGYFDLPVKGMVLETDIKFCIRTVFDFFVFSSVWERQLVNVFQWKKGMKFLDVGAHIGKYTVRAGTNVGKDGKVVAIEANADNFRLLLQNIQLNELQNCVPLNMAAYSKDTQITLFIGPDSAKNSVKEDSGKGSYTVKARALDNVLEEVGMKQVDLIKIDVEGSEYEVLEGLANTLRNERPVLMVEMLVQDKDKVLQYMHELGYTDELLPSYSPYHGGVLYYCFHKE